MKIESCFKDSFTLPKRKPKSNKDIMRFDFLSTVRTKKFKVQINNFPDVIYELKF